jgi:cysteinyl-tRNA synthetase
MVAIVLLSSGCLFGDEEVDPEAEMRSLVGAISDKGRQTDPDFIVIANGGAGLVTDDGSPGGSLKRGYLKAIDGVGHEDLFFGFGDIDSPSSPERVEAISRLLNVSRFEGKVALVTDHASQNGYIWDALQWSDDRDFIPFVSPDHNYTDVPRYPKDPWGAHNGDVATLSAASNYLLLTDPSNFQCREDYLDTLRSNRYDLLVISPFFNGTALTPEEVDSLRTKLGGGHRLVLAYVNVARADEGAPYWIAKWDDDRPDWMGGADPARTDSYRVEYWQSGWKRVLYKGEGSLLDSVLGSTFDGVYLDDVNAYERYS